MMKFGLINAQVSHAQQHFRILKDSRPILLCAALHWQKTTTTAQSMSPNGNLSYKPNIYIYVNWKMLYPKRLMVL